MSDFSTRPIDWLTAHLAGNKSKLLLPRAAFRHAFLASGLKSEHQLTASETLYCLGAVGWKVWIGRILPHNSYLR